MQTIENELKGTKKIIFLVVDIENSKILKFPPSNKNG